MNFKVIILAAATAILTACAGPKGEAGQNGADAVIEVINPCGDAPGYDEILLRLVDGRLLAYFEQGNKRFLAEIGPGNYQTTDAERCQFTVNKQLEVSWQ